MNEVGEIRPVVQYRCSQLKNMLTKIFNYLGRKLIESELDNLIKKFAEANNEQVVFLHSCAKDTPGTWELIFEDEVTELCGNLLQMDREDINEKIKKGIAILGPLFTRVQRESNEEFTKFGFLFWRVVFLSMIHPELEIKGKYLGKIIQKQSDVYVSELIQRTESIIGEKVQNVDSLRDTTLVAIYPVLYS
jgi:hypothetical protein